MWKLKSLEASHPRVAGTVQAHRQQIDAAADGQQQMSQEDIQKKVTRVTGKRQSHRLPTSDWRLRIFRMRIGD
jgi:hypothetical protein